MTEYEDMTFEKGVISNFHHMAAKVKTSDSY